MNFYHQIAIFALGVVTALLSHNLYTSWKIKKYGYMSLIPPEENPDNYVVGLPEEDSQTYKYDNFCHLTIENFPKSCVENIKKYKAKGHIDGYFAAQLPVPTMFLSGDGLYACKKGTWLVRGWHNPEIRTYSEEEFNKIFTEIPEDEFKTFYIPKEILNLVYPNPEVDVIKYESIFMSTYGSELFDLKEGEQKYYIDKERTVPFTGWQISKDKQLVYENAVITINKNDLILTYDGKRVFIIPEDTINGIFEEITREQYKEYELKAKGE